MSEFKNIMVALAFSKHAKDIFGYGVKLATYLDADLTVASIINSRDVEAVETIVSMGYKVDGEHYVESIEKERREILEKIIGETSFPRERINILLQVGNPIDELLKIISEKNIDMVIMGSKGRTDLRHVLIGSVAEKMFRRSPVTVVSYRDESYAGGLERLL